MTVRRSSMEKTADLLAGYLPLLRLQGSPQRAQTQESRGFGEFATTPAGPGPCRSPRVAPEIVVKRRRTYPRHLSPAINVGATHISAQVPQPIRRAPELHSLLGSALHGDMVGKGSTGYVGTCGQHAGDVFFRSPMYALDRRRWSTRTESRITMATWIGPICYRRRRQPALDKAYPNSFRTAPAQAQPRPKVPPRRVN